MKAPHPPPENSHHHPALLHHDPPRKAKAQAKDRDSGTHNNNNNHKDSPLPPLLPATIKDKAKDNIHNKEDALLEVVVVVGGITKKRSDLLSLGTVKQATLVVVGE